MYHSQDLGILTHVKAVFLFGNQYLRYMKPRAYSFQPQLQIGCYHVAQAEKLFVRKVELHELMQRWLPLHQGETLPKDDAYYVECHRQGFVDWKSCNVYTSSQLVGRNNVYVVSLQSRKRS